MALIYPGGLTDTDFSDGTTTGGWAPQNFLYGSHFVLASGGTVTQMGVKAKSNSGSAVGLKFGLYDSGGNLVVQSTGSVSGTTLAWINSGAVSQSVSAGTYYLLISSQNTDGQYGYDTSGNGSFATEAYATAMQATESITAEGDTGQLYGVRMDFTASAGSPALSGPLLVGPPNTLLRM